MVLGQRSQIADEIARGGDRPASASRQESPFLHPRAADALIAVSPPRAATVVFADLVGFTTLAEVHGDRIALELLDEFAVIVRRLARRWGVREVKAIGDGFLLATRNPSAALAFANQALAEMGARDRQLGLRLGLHAGPVVERDGDVLGRTVNLAARVLAQARDGEALATGEALVGARVPVRSRIEGPGRRRLRGIPDEVELYSLRPIAVPARVTDPTCQMKLNPSTALRCAVGDDNLYFCSETCMSSFTGAWPIAGSSSNRDSCLLARRKKRDGPGVLRKVAPEWQ